MKANVADVDESLCERIAHNSKANRLAVAQLRDHPALLIEEAEEVQARSDDIEAV